MIHTSITVGFTTGQYLAFQCYTDDPQDWLENAAHEACRRSWLDIKAKYTSFKIDREEAIVAVGQTAMIQAAITENVVINHVTGEGGLTGIAVSMLPRDDSPD